MCILKALLEVEPRLLPFLRLLALALTLPDRSYCFFRQRRLIQFMFCLQSPWMRQRRCPVPKTVEVREAGLAVLAPSFWVKSERVYKGFHVEPGWSPFSYQFSETLHAYSPELPSSQVFQGLSLCHEATRLPPLPTDPPADCRGLNLRRVDSRRTQLPSTIKADGQTTQLCSNAKRCLP